ncbi:hypothetical protein [Mesorhizobium kowhaii]|nr:hypothetical protein [Mesorhizobium kowhaii]
MTVAAAGESKKPRPSLRLLEVVAASGELEPGNRLTTGRSELPDATSGKPKVAGHASNVVAHSVTWYEGGGNTIVQADVDGNTTADLTIILTGINHNLTGLDFSLKETSVAQAVAGVNDGPQIRSRRQFSTPISAIKATVLAGFQLWQ